MRSAGEVATHFAVSERTVGSWRRVHGMPGKPGRYDLDAIAAWRAERGVGRKRTQSEERTRLLRIEAALKKQRLRKLRGELVSADELRRVIVRHIHEAKSLLEQLPDRVVARLPDDCRRSRDIVRETARRLVCEACLALADSLLSISSESDAE